MKAEPKKSETRPVAVMDRNTWLCPFCRRLNGVAERPKCGCGAKLDGETAKRA